MLRVAAGWLKGHALTAPKHIRPTEGQVRQAMFNVLQAIVPNARVLDGYAGSGALGIEALSRGAAEVVFVESDAECVKAIERNLQSAELAEVPGRWSVIEGDVPGTLNKLARRGSLFDIVLLDPPYADDAGKKALRAVDRYAILAPAGVLCLEHLRSQAFPATVGSLKLLKRHRYGKTVLSFYQAASSDSPASHDPASGSPPAAEA